MSPNSLGMTMSSLPTPTPSAAPAFDASLSKKQSASTDSSGTATAGTDPLMAALSQTLAQLGYTMPAASLDTSTTSGADTSDDSGPGAAASSASSATTTGAKFLAALYQALALQQSISAGNGGTASVDDSGSTTASLGDATSSGSGVSAYLDLGSRIAGLSNAVSATDDADSDAGEWDIEFDDVSEPSDEEDPEEGDPLDDAISNLNDALQAHVAALDQDPGATVTLSDVLAGLSGTAGGVSWQPVGVMIDVSA